MATPTTLPASFTAGQVLTAAQMNDVRGAFRILQVVEGTYSTTASSSSATMADTGLSATITPSSTSSKILVYANHSVCQKGAQNLGNRIDCQIVRGSTAIANLFSQFFNGVANDVRGGISLIKLDSPNTVSATTYKTQFANGAGVASVTMQVDSSLSTIILMEVSA